jgi:pilus assembly protein CpaB
MNPNRQALLLAFAVAAVGGALLVLYLRRFEIEKSGGEPVRVLVVTKALAAGSQVTDQVLGVREIPVAYVDNRAVRQAEREKIIGLRTGVALEASDTLLWGDLAVSADEHRDLSSLVLPGFRAVQIRAASGDRGSSLIGPGDYVDLIATLPTQSGRPDGTTAIVLLQRVLVLANGDKLTPAETPAGTDGRATQPLREVGLTLSLSLRDAQRVALAAERAHFSVALRNPEDPRTIDDMPDMTEEALTEGCSRAVAAGRSSAPPTKLREALVAAVTR